MITLATIHIVLSLTFSLLVIYLSVRLRKVSRFRHVIIDFCANNIDEYQDRFLWFDVEIATLNKMVSSFAPLESFIVGKYKNEFLKYYAGRK